MNRRELIGLLGVAGACGLFPASVFARRKAPGDPYEVPPTGHVRLLHITDCHGQLLPIYYREPNANIGVGAATGRAPHLVGAALLEHFGIAPSGLRAHAFSHLNFTEAARRFGKVGGFAHLRTLVSRLRGEFGETRTLLLDGGDTWQGSGTALWTRGKDMVGAANLLGVDVMTGHWEFTYGEQDVLANLARLQGEFLAQNVSLTEEALFEGAPAYDDETGHAFKPYSIKVLDGKRVAIIGQAFPYTPIANPGRFVPNWTFGIRDATLQALVRGIREAEKPDAVILLSHNGMDVDLKMASRVSGIDVILGGHTHDAMPAPSQVKNPGGVTLVTNAGSHGKFLGVMDLELGEGRVRGYRYKLLPVFSNLIEPDPEMGRYIAEVREPYLKRLQEPLATADILLYRRGNFNGTFDQIICDAQRVVGDAQIAFSPGFRWGTTVLPGQVITLEHVLEQTGITYPETYVGEMTGEEIKGLLESVCDNLFNSDPYYQSGGDMVRVGGLSYVCHPAREMNRRIADLTLDTGEPLRAGKRYKVAGWASVGSRSPGPPIWEVVAEYLRAEKVARIHRLDTPRLEGVAGNPGIADYPV